MGSVMQTERTATTEKVTAEYATNLYALMRVSTSNMVGEAVYSVEMNKLTQ